jgi:uncharacterized protein (TIGR02117 family)
MSNKLKPNPSPWKATAAGALLACATALSAVLGGCATLEPNRIALEPPLEGVRSIFVVAHSYHSGLAVRTRDVPADAWPAQRDFPNADYLEVGWGEREYYAQPNPGLSVILHALFVPSLSTIHVVPVTGSLTSFFLNSEIVELHVPQAGFERMVAFVRDTYELDAEGRPVSIPSGPDEVGRFYASKRTFHITENCNVWVARALEAAGLPVHPKEATTVGRLLQQVRSLSVAAPAES